MQLVIVTVSKNEPVDDWLVETMNEIQYLPYDLYMPSPSKYRRPNKPSNIHPEKAAVWIVEQEACLLIWQREPLFFNYELQN